MISDGQNGILDYVNCSGSELSLWHCKGKHGEQSESFPCSSVAYVVCAGKRLLLFTPPSHVMNQTRNFFFFFCCCWILIKSLKHALHMTHVLWTVS